MSFPWPRSIVRVSRRAEEATLHTRAHTTPPKHAELRSFLTACRARLQPSDVGLPEPERRRAPGLRREDIAELVGVSPKWYAVFEAGKSNRHFSADFVHRVAEALRLDDRDRVRLLRLALPEAADVARYFEAALAIAEKAAIDARAALEDLLATSNST